MEVKENYVYKKTKFPSNCIYISNLGKNCCLSDQKEIIKELEKIGKFKEFYLGENSHSFLTFENIEDSKRFYEYYNSSLKGSPLLIAGRKVQIEFSERIKKKIKIPVIENYFENLEFLSKKGLIVIENFISNAESQNLIDWFDNMGIWEDKLNRKVQHYGFSFDYQNKIISESWKSNIPDIIQVIINHLLQQNLIKEIPDQITINDYKVGQGIGPHIDSHHTIGEDIIVLSLGSDILIDFYQVKISEKLFKNKVFERVCKKTVLIPENSLYIMKDEIRYCWEHGIKSRKTDFINGCYKQRKRRISITFRKYKRDHLLDMCGCKYENFCDSRSLSLRILPERI